MTSNPDCVNIQEAKNNFSKLLARAHAGEEIVICKAGKPYVKLVPIDQPEQRELGFLSDLFTEEELEAIDRALSEPMSEEELALWYGVPAREMLHLADREAEPEQIAAEIDQLFKAGWFDAESDVIRVALLAYLRHHRFALQERFQLEDIAWALEQKKQSESDR